MDVITAKKKTILFGWSFSCVTIKDMDLYNEAAQVLDESQIVKVLEEFGDVVLEGSFVYRTMVDRDIDLHVILKEGVDLSYDTRAAVMVRLMQLPNLRSIEMSDVHHFPAGSKHRNDGIWYGPGLISSVTGERWNIDVWLFGPGAATGRNLDLAKRLLNLTDEERDTITAIKQFALDAGLKEKGVTSMEIYRCVLNEGVSSYEEYLVGKKSVRRRR